MFYLLGFRIEANDGGDIDDDNYYLVDYYLKISVVFISFVSMFFHPVQINDCLL